MRFCFILLIALPVFAADVPAYHRVTTIVRADVKTGKLIRSVAAPVSTPAATNSAPPTDETLLSMIDRIADEQGVEAPLVHSVIKTESNYHATALSPKGAQGMMQLIPATAKRFGVMNAMDAQQNIEGGVRYLKFLLDYFNGDYVKAIAAYNAGENAVDKYKGIPPYAETQNYVVQVAKNLKAARARHAAAEAKTVETASVANVPAETSSPVQASIGSDGRLYYRTP